VTVTVAFGTAAPLASLTWPTMALVVSPCGSVLAGQNSAALTRRNTASVVRDISETPAFWKGLGQGAIAHQPNVAASRNNCD